jgi:hypothetical protein
MKLRKKVRWSQLPYFTSTFLGSLVVFLFFAWMFSIPKEAKKPVIYEQTGLIECQTDAQCGENAFCQDNLCQCQSAYGDCNQEMSDGCEVDLMISQDNCGQCGQPCLEGTICQEGQCQ